MSLANAAAASRAKAEAALFGRLDKFILAVAKTHGRVNNRMLKIIERLTPDG